MDWTSIYKVMISLITAGVGRGEEEVEGAPEGRGEGAGVAWTSVC